MFLSWKIAAAICIVFWAFLIAMISDCCGQPTCEKGFVLEQKDGKYNCRNPFCDVGQNFYGESKDKGFIYPDTLMSDANGKARPRVKDANGKWVGWTIGAYQCQPDPIGLHPNPDYVFDSKTPMPKNLRIANAKPKWLVKYKSFDKIKNRKQVM